MIFRESALLSRGFSWDAAASHVNACRIAYGADDVIRHAFSEVGMSVRQVFSFGATQGYVVEGSRIVLCAFRGTDSIADWIANLDVARMVRPYGEVHRGFLGAYAPAAPAIRDALARARSGGKAFWLTGHSLGGALAQVAAHDLAGTYDRIGLYTFGQPRTANVSPAHRLSTVLGLDYHRMVNGRDYVTRIPGALGHGGRLVRLDPGSEAFVDPERDADAEGLPPVDAAEFARDQARIRAIRAGIDAAAPLGAPSESTLAPAGRDRLLDATTEGFLPGIRDHAIADYARNVLLNVASGTRKRETVTELLGRLSSSKLGSVARPDHRRALTDPGDGAESVGADAEIFAPSGPPVGLGVAPDDTVPGRLMPVLVRTTGEDWTPSEALAEQSRIGRFRTLLATAGQIDALRGDDGVLSIEMSRDAGIADLDTTLPFVGGDAVQRPPVSESGDAALVGLIDSGLDILHRAFLGRDGRTRIRAIWNQRDQRGPSPHAVDPAFPQATGTLHLAVDLQAEIDAFEAGGAPPHWLLRDAGKGHGTHVAGIMAGAATSLLGPGMAPGAGIVAVIPNMMTAAGDPQSLGYSVSHLDALAFLKQAARGGNRVIPGPGLPIAVNMSLGMNAGAHDGSTLLEAAIDATTGNGADPGIVLVKSAGNERGLGGHAAIPLTGAPTDIVWTSEDVARDVDYFEGWFDSNDDLSFVLTNPLGHALPRVSLAERRAAQVLDGNLCQMELTRIFADNGESRLVISVSPDTAPIHRGDWTLEVRANRIRTARATFDLWVERMDNRAVRFGRETDETTISIPGTAHHIVTVAASDTGANPRLTGTSSYGLTRDGRAKPDLAAPGQGVISARANAADREAVTAMTGTSMAAPHVTGALALAMSRRAKSGRKQFNARQLTRAAIASARQVGPLHHLGYGNGILDVKALLDLLDLEP